MISKKTSFTASGATWELTLNRTDGKLCLTGAGNSEVIDEAISDVVIDLPWIHVHINGGIESCAIAHDTKGVWVTLKGRTYLFERTRPAHESARTASPGASEVRAPMTGTVLSVHVAQGDRVTRGELLAIIEAMKMEYRVEAGLDGTVDQLHCSTGDLLELGTVMIRLKPDVKQ